MHRAVVCALSLATLFAVAPTARAQEPPRTKEVKEAEKFITTALIINDTAEKRSRFERALNPLQEAMAKDAGNARVWVTAGQVYAGLHEFARADSALKKAEQLYPAFAPETNDIRVQAWSEAFNLGVTLMDAQKYDDAIKAFENAEMMYPQRPESKVNLGALYANKGDIAKAESYFHEAMAITEGPQKDKLKPEEAAAWKHMDELSKANVAQMEGQKGVEAFEAQKYDDAITAFRAAHELNPGARDFVYNLAQSIYAKAAKVEQARNKLLEDQKAATLKKNTALAKAKADSAATLAAELVKDYTEVEPLAIQAREADPNNEDLYLLQARSYRVRGDITTDPAQKTDYLKRVDLLLKQHEEMPVEVNGVMVATTATEATVKGTVHNRKVTAAAPIKIHFALFNLAGASVGEGDVTVAAPAANADVPFQVTIKTTGDVAAWKYKVTL